MPRPVLRVLANGRFAPWGLERTQDNRFTCLVGNGEVETILIDLSGWLDSAETISSVALADQAGATITTATNTAQTGVVVTVSAVSQCSRSKVALLLTTSAGRIRRVELGFMSPHQHYAGCAYRGAWGYGDGYWGW